MHPTCDEYLGGCEFQLDEINYDSDFPSPLDVDYIFFDADREGLCKLLVEGEHAPLSH